MFNLIDHRLSVPLRHGEPTGDSIEVFAREVVAHGGQDRPVLVFLQGGPGHESPRPSERPIDPPWLPRALEDYRVVMLDQRGTGLSTPFGQYTMDQLDGSHTVIAEYLTHFRADAIVQDCEILRKHLGLEKISLLGQSFGGFTALHYLSVAAEHLAEVFFTGGLPPVARHCDDVYAATYRTQRSKNESFYERFPEARARMAQAVARCDAGEVRLPNGQSLTARLLRTIGSHLGFSGGERLLAAVLERDPRSPAFAADVAGLLPFKGRNPLYSVIHESSYSDGCVTDWSASRMLPDDYRNDPTLFTSEHLFPWHFEDDPELTPYREVAEILAQHRWPALYDTKALAASGVPGAAAVFTTDPFVDLEFSRETAALMPDLSSWETGDHDHNAIRVEGGPVLDELFGRIGRP